MTTSPEKQVEKSPYAEYREAWAKLSVTQKARVKIKQQWERRSAFAIFTDFPALFDPDRVQDEDELKACRELIEQRPELFPEAPDA